MFNIKDKLFNVKNFFKNVWIFRAFLVRDRWYDSDYLLHMLRDKITYDVGKYKTLAMQMYPEPVIEKMELCVHLLDRILADDYYDNALKDYGGTGKLPIDAKSKRYRRVVRHSVKMMQNDVDYLFMIMSKHIKVWWD